MSLIPFKLGFYVNYAGELTLFVELWLYQIKGEVLRMSSLTIISQEKIID